MKKLLYVDVPFANIKGGDKNRSNFIWSTLRKEYEADLLLLLAPEYAFKKAPEHSGYIHNFHLVITKSLPYQSSAIYQFHNSQKHKFEELLKLHQYDIIVFRFLSTYHLAEIAEKTLPNCKIAIDVDMLFSRISELSWQDNKNIHNRYHLLEMIKLKAFEKKAFTSNFSFYFTNYLERDMAIRDYHLLPENAYIIPNMMPKEATRTITPRKQEENYILFFGTLDSMANQDAYLYLVKEIYPRIESVLKEKDISVYIVGKNPGSIHSQFGGERIKVIGPVEDIESQIANSLFVVLPLRIASGTRTRILEAAAVEKAVITTTIGVEGFLFEPDEVVIQDTADAFATSMIDLIENPERAITMGKKLYTKAVSQYAPEVVAKELIAKLNQDVKPATTQITGKRLKLAIITNRFFPEVGGAETNIYYQARLLAKDYDLTVICPKRIDKPKEELTDGFRIIRMQDVFNIPPRYPNLSSKTLCPELFFYLLQSDYDIIQCFPALNYNNVITFIAAKIRKIPYILCFFDFIDYAGLAKTEGRIDPNILKSVHPSLYQRIVLKGMDYAFAIAEKEIQFIKQFNPKIEYSPVPILPDEYSTPVANPRSKLGFTENDFIFLSLGRVSNIKGQDIALKAFGEAAKDMPNAKLVFVGRTDYEKDFYADMQAFIAQNSLQDKVFFTGMVERDEVLGWLRYSDIHVIPVRFMNSGAVVVESWISDTPVLQSDVVDPNLVVEGKNGYIFKSEDVHECSQKMILAYQNKELLPQMAVTGKELVMSKYTYEYLIGLYSQTYKKLLKNKQGNR